MLTGRMHDVKWATSLLHSKRWRRPFSVPRSEKKSCIYWLHWRWRQRVLHNNGNYFLVDTVSYTRIPQYELIIYLSDEVRSTCLPSEAAVITETTRSQPIVNIGSSSTTLITQQHFSADIRFNVNNTAMVPYRKCSKPVNVMAYEEIC